jgi:hypothetical protein
VAGNQPSGTPAGPVAAEPNQPLEPSAAPAAVDLVVRAAAGESWMQVRRGGGTGHVLWEGVLPQGDTATFEGKRLWLRVGDASALQLTLNGDEVTNVPTTGNLLVTPAGITVVSLS